jgi:hypothetical protein
MARIADSTSHPVIGTSPQSRLHIFILIQAEHTVDVADLFLRLSLWSVESWTKSGWKGEIQISAHHAVCGKYE